jgi:hypothetical protein
MRARNVKPGFFQNEQLAELPIPARLLFAGLWCMADREGRLEDRPLRIKMHIFPADMLDVEPLIAGLAEQKLIVRYVVDGKRCIWIPEFLKHQRPHHKEAESVLPAFHMEPKTPTQVRASTDLGAFEPALNPDSLIPESSLSEREPPPAGLDLQAWNRWVAYKREIRKPIKPASLLAAQRKLAGFGSDQAAVVEQSVAQGWTGLFDLKETNGKPRQNGQPRVSALERVYRATEGAFLDDGAPLGGRLASDG